MKKIFSYAAMLFAGILVLTSCEKDMDSNPMLVQPDNFVLNTPVIGTACVDLANSADFGLTWSQPVYNNMNTPMVVTYEVQVSPTNSFNKAFNFNSEENPGADYFVLGETTTQCNTTVYASALGRNLQQFFGWEDAGQMPSTVDLSLRVLAAVKNAGGQDVNPIVSNVLNFQVQPFFTILKEAEPIMWYLVGNMFGGKWGSVIGETALPMFLKPGFEYNKVTGAGEIQYLNYFETGSYKDNGECDAAGFKIQRADFDWNYGMTGEGSTYDKIIFRNNGNDGGHIVAGENGYYLITMNTDDNSATMVKQDIAPKNYGPICLSGDLNGWGDTEMLPYNKDGVENHAWYYVLDVTQEMLDAGGRVDAAQIKFKIQGSWETNWGYGENDGDVNFIGTGTQGGKNIGLPIGKYCISFNDITGDFSIVAL